MVDNTEIYNIRAFHLTTNIELKSCVSNLKNKIITENKSELFAALDEDQYIFIFSYGVVVFYHVEEKQIKSLLKQLFPYFSHNNELPVDDFSIRINRGEELRADFDSLSLAFINQEAIKIAMLNVAQSVALMHYDRVSQDMLAKVRLFTTQMEEEGRLKISRKNIMKFVGKALNTKNKIAENLYIFDAPAVTWNDEYLEKLNTTLSKHFELSVRYRSIENNFNIIGDNLHAFMELYHQNESSKLEWIIIILILVEVLDTFITKAL